MRSKLQWMAVLALAFLVAHAIAEQMTVLKTSKEKMSYAIGVEMARNLQRMEVDVAPDVLTKAMRDVLSGETLLISDEDLRLAISSYQAGLRQRQAKALKTAAEKNKKEGDAFLEANKAKQGVVMRPSGRSNARRPSWVRFLPPRVMKPCAAMTRPCRRCWRLSP